MDENEPRTIDQGEARSGADNEGAGRKQTAGKDRRSKWQEFYLARLERLAALRGEVCGSQVSDEERHWKTDLVNRAIYSCFCDCVELEVKDEAREVLKEASGKTQ